MPGRYITSNTYLQQRMQLEVYNRAFDKDGVGSAQQVEIDNAIAEAESEVDMILGAYVGGVFLNANGSIVDPALLGHMVDMTIFHAVKRGLSAGGEENAPAKRNYDRAVKRFEALAKDDMFRARTAAGGPTQPQPVIDNVTQADGSTPNNPWTQAADNRTGSNF